MDETALRIPFHLLGFLEIVNATNQWLSEGRVMVQVLDDFPSNDGPLRIIDFIALTV